MPATNVTTTMTAATLMTTPSSVRAERSLLPHSDWSAIRIASRRVMEIRRYQYGKGTGNVQSSSSLSPGGFKTGGDGKREQLRPEIRPANIPLPYNHAVSSRTGRPLFPQGEGGKSELRRAVCRITSGRLGSSPV